MCVCVCVFNINRYENLGPRHFNDYDKAYFKNSKLTREQKVAKVPSMADLKLGSCAIVGNADNLLKGK